MKSIIKIFMAIAIVFVGLGSFATFINPNLDITKVRASHILVKTRPESVKIKKEIEDGNITFEDAARQYSLCPSGQNGGDLGYFTRKQIDRKSTRLNSSHQIISYAVFYLKKKIGGQKGTRADVRKDRGSRTGGAAQLI